MIGLNQIGVDQVREQLCFRDEIVYELVLPCEARSDDLDGDVFYEIPGSVLLRLIHGTNRSLINQFQDLISIVALDREKAHCAGVFREDAGAVKFIAEACEALPFPNPS